MFDFMDMEGSYEQRKVDNFTGKDGLVVDTVAVTDSTQPFETAVCHEDFNAGRWIIVELYNTKEEAQVGHDKWIKIMTETELPKTLKDVSEADIIKFGKAFGCNMNETYKRSDNA